MCHLGVLLINCHLLSPDDGRVAVSMDPCTPWEDPSSHVSAIQEETPLPGDIKSQGWGEEMAVAKSTGVCEAEQERPNS